MCRSSSKGLRGDDEDIPKESERTGLGDVSGALDSDSHRATGKKKLKLRASSCLSSPCRRAHITNGDDAEEKDDEDGNGIAPDRGRQGWLM